jgi:hypothetical protein
MSRIGTAELVIGQMGHSNSFVRALQSNSHFPNICVIRVIRGLKRSILLNPFNASTV